MGVVALSKIVANRAVARAAPAPAPAGAAPPPAAAAPPPAAALAPPSALTDKANSLLSSIGTYIPADVTALYIPVAAGLAAGNTSSDTKLYVALGAAGLAAFAAWVAGHKRAAAKAAAAHSSPPKAWLTLKAGWYEIAAAGVGLFAWATAIPASWHHWSNSSAWAPALIVGLTALVIGGVAVLLNRPTPDAAPDSAPVAA